MPRAFVTAVLLSSLLACVPPVDERPMQTAAPDGGPPLGGNVVVEWDGDAALDPADVVTAGASDAGR